jgi:regulator of sigma E protease
VKPADAVPPPGADAPGSPDADAEAAPPPAPPLTPLAWFKQNGWFFIALAALIGFVLSQWGWGALWKGALVVLGLSLVIVIHELGHFLAAKWCDVHVLTFSLGFGPALPGCSFKRGETTFKICMIPLGGFVQMVGEGSEADEDDNYPRSFKKKTVWQRMFIISAGVIMNVLLGCVCFVLVYQFHGLEVPAAVVGQVEAGSPAWREGVPAGSTILRIGETDVSTFEDLTDFVHPWHEGDGPIKVTLRNPDGKEQTVLLTPRCDANDLLPVIGVAQPRNLKLPPAKVKPLHDRPVRFFSAAAAARVIDLRPGDEVLRATDPDRDDDELTKLTGGLDELCRRMRRLAGRPLTLEVRRKGAAEPEKVEVPDKGFEFDDLVVGASDPDGDDPLAVTALSGDPGGADEFFAFVRRMKRLAGRPAVVEVRRDGAAAPVRLLVPPAFHLDFGATMKMGEVAGVREKSPAAEAGVREGDVITAARLTWDGDDHPLELAGEQLDPVRLPDDLARKARAAPAGAKVRAALTVSRWDTPENPHGQSAKVLPPMDWDARWAGDVEVPYSPAAALAVPELGVAYRVESTVVHVREGSPADKAGLKVNDQIRQIRFKTGKTAADGQWPSGASDWNDMKSTRTLRGGSEGEVYDQWAHYFYAAEAQDFPEVQVRVWRDNQLVKKENEDAPKDFELTAAEADEAPRAWPADDRGLLFMGDKRLQKAGNILEALGMGAGRTVRSIRQIYQSIVILVRRPKATKLVQGPLRIAEGTFVAAEDPFILILVLGIISVNLAVVNFLPIPLLDGGHMVFLIYELLRRRPPSDAVKAIASYVGLAMIALLMVFVFYQDIVNIWFR